MTDHNATADPAAAPTDPAAGAPADPAAAPTDLAAGAVVLEDGAAPAAAADVWASPYQYGPFLPPETEEQRRERVRRRRATALRRGAVGLVLALAVAGTAVVVTLPARTDLPGLATPNDGRYSFPALALPPLPSGRPAPSAPDGGGRHYADLRYLLLPAPKEAGGSLAPAAAAATSAAASSAASASASAPAAAAGASPSGTASAAAGGASADWVTCDQLVAEQQDPAKTTALLLENACRAATVRQWTAEDGTRTQIRLLRFGSQEEASGLSRYLWTSGGPKGVSLRADSGKDIPSVVGVAALLRSNRGDLPGGPATTRVGFLLAGDVVGVVVMTNPTNVPVQAFRQVVTLQSDLLA
ncbi:hypothetical protein [Kitasatospora sp. NBC_00315]|uniref:hypothetical protein n=1 Tax=Kitasatospora sp. NBC_00315 TaxID=2975963 RepID=UPI003251A9DE